MTANANLLPTASAAETRRLLVQLARPQRRLASVAAVLLVAAAVVGLLGPAILGRIVDLAISQRPASSISIYVAALALAAVGQGALTAGGDVVVARLGETLLAGLRERVVERTLQLPLEQVELAGSGDLVSRVTGDVSIIAEAIRSAFPRLVSAGLTIGLTFVGMLALDWRLGLAAGCAVPIQVQALRWYLRRSAPIYGAERIAEGARAQQLYESINGAATVRAFRLGPGHAEAIARRSHSAIELSLSATRVRTRLYGRLNYAELVGMVAILATGFVLVRSDSITVGAATAAALYFLRLFDPINTFLSLVDDAQAAGAAAARLAGIAQLGAEQEPLEAQAPRDGSISIRGLHHAYRPGHDVVRGIDLEIHAGTHVAVIGASGAGKSTLAKLVAGIHEARAGEILIGGASHRQLGPATVRRTVALLTQETHVFAGSLADDLRLARPEATDADLRAALAEVGCGWVASLPAGLETPIGDGGHRLSVTQAQQLALVRLQLADPRIAVVDEATADAGSAGARVLEASARTVLRGRTALIVAHRLTQAAGADEIVVLDHGVVVERGTHAELLELRGVYARVWSTWEQPGRSG